MRKLFLIMVFIMVILGGCGTKAETPEQSVTKALTAIKNLDNEAAQIYFANEDLFDGKLENEALKNDETAKLVVEKLSFKTLSSSIKENTATVKTEITNIDVGSIFGEYVKQAMSIAFSNAFSGNKLSDEDVKQQADKMFSDLLKKEDNKTITSTVDIQLTKSDTGWKINMDDSLSDAILGGLVSAGNKMSGDFNGNTSSSSNVE
ncbi:DUF5105 domain-containing protein [Desulfosporosinus fructosivorans]